MCGADALMRDIHVFPQSGMQGSEGIDDFPPNSEGIPHGNHKFASNLWD